MLDIENKFATASRKIAGLRSLHGDQAMQEALDDAERVLGQVTGKASGMVAAQAAGSRMMAAVSCLGLQLPIPDMPDVLEEFAGVIKGLSDGVFFDLWLDVLDDPDLAALAGLKEIAGDLMASLDGLESLLADFSEIRGSINNALATVSALVSCTDPVTGMGLGQRFNTIDGVLKEVNPEFKAGLDAAAAAQNHFSNPVEVLNDAKARVTGSLDLDGKVTRIKDQFHQTRDWLG